MNTKPFDWDFENISHIARHGVSPEDAEDVLLSEPEDLGSEIVEGELRFSNLGLTRYGETFHRRRYMAWQRYESCHRIPTEW